MQVDFIKRQINHADLLNRFQRSTGRLHDIAAYSAEDGAILAAENWQTIGWIMWIYENKPRIP